MIRSRCLIGPAADELAGFSRSPLFDAQGQYRLVHDTDRTMVFDEWECLMQLRTIVMMQSTQHKLETAEGALQPGKEPT